VVEFDADFQAYRIEEKPARATVELPRSPASISTDNDVCQIAADIQAVRRVANSIPDVNSFLSRSRNLT